jgi:hypothetical protein
MKLDIRVETVTYPEGGSRMTCEACGLLATHMVVVHILGRSRVILSVCAGCAEGLAK